MVRLLRPAAAVQAVVRLAHNEIAAIDEGVIERHVILGDLRHRLALQLSVLSLGWSVRLCVSLYVHVFVNFLEGTFIVTHA